MRAILGARLSEKSLTLAQQHQYTFIVSEVATISQIKRELKSLYKVEAVDIRFIHMPSKTVRRGNHYGERSGIRKAIVQLKPNQKIDDFQVSEK